MVARDRLETDRILAWSRGRGETRCEEREKLPRVMVDVKPHIFTLHAEKIFCHCHAIHQQKEPLSTLPLARDLNLDRHVLGSPGFLSSEFRSYRRRPLLGPVLISTLLDLSVVFLRVRKA